MIDFILDNIEIILIIFLIILLSISVNMQFKDKVKCEENGGIVIEKFMGYQCITKQDIEKLRGEE